MSRLDGLDNKQENDILVKILKYGFICETALTDNMMIFQNYKQVFKDAILIF